LRQEAAAIERAIEATLRSGLRTADIAPAGVTPVGTTAFTDAVVKALSAE
jgi:isocitrate/isopropylmalate dehydrogenase